MYNFFRLMLCVITVALTSSCVSATDKTLSPPSDTKWINVEIKNPSQYTKPFPLEVVYISHKCTRERINGFDGSVIIEPSYNGIKIPLTQSGDDLWRAKIALSGGGSCDWTLSEFNLGIAYTNATHLGKDLVPGTAVGATIAFDDDATKNGQFTRVQGDLSIRPTYYPYIREWHLVRQENELTLLAKENFLSYRVINADNILYAPVLDESKLVKSIEPLKKVDGVHSKIIYPDGSVISDGTIFPDYDKVESMVVK
ncbi:hypothetical protein [Cronobacter dublinensis]|uniref:hypothetical protein n=1 Tax=Cronobacter dublinensis TaxID=413497 RepID=UPI000CFE84B4|nr:hypothetical protein [Cronobacter dublinensis]